MLTLMQGFEPEDGSFVLQYPDRWSEAAKKFLALLILESYENTLAVSLHHLLEAGNF